MQENETGLEERLLERKGVQGIRIPGALCIMGAFYHLRQSPMLAGVNGVEVLVNEVIFAA